MNEFEHHTLRDRTLLLLRPVQAQDASALGRLIEGLGPADRGRRFHGAPAGLPTAILQRMVRPQPPRELAWIAIADPHGAAELVADVRCVADSGACDAEFGLLVAPRWRRLGVGRCALAALRRAAARSGLRCLQGSVLPDNLPMLALMRRAGFRCEAGRRSDGLVAVECRTADEVPACEGA